MSLSTMLPETVNKQPHELECICQEPEGDFLRRAYLLPMSRENLLMFWEKARKYPILFGKEVSDDYTRFLEVFFGMSEGGEVYTKGILWIIDYYVGAFYLTNITDTEATIHYTFFDGRIKGRLLLGKTVIDYIFKKFGFHKINAEVPEFASPATFMFIRKLGFIEEGIKRACVKYHKNPDAWYDRHEFGILAEQQKGDYKRWAAKFKKSAEALQPD